MNNSKSLFSEEQKFTQWWIWVLLACSFGFSIFTMLYTANFNEDNFIEILKQPVYIFVGISMLLVILLFVLIKLKTNIDEEKIAIHFSPFIKKEFHWKDIDKAEVINYGFIGGWGIRLFTKYGTAYNIKGSVGLALELKNGKKYLIGTQKEEELKSGIANLNRD